jgi:hypothetical protein
MYLVLIMSYHPYKSASVNLNLPSFTCRAVNLMLKKTKRFTAKPPGARRGSGNYFLAACLFFSRPLRLAVPRFFICVITGKALGFYSPSDPTGVA